MYMECTDMYWNVLECTSMNAAPCVTGFHKAQCDDANMPDAEHQPALPAADPGSEDRGDYYTPCQEYEIILNQDQIY